MGSNLRFFDYDGDGYDDLTIGGGYYSSSSKYVYLINGDPVVPTGRKSLGTSSNYDVRFEAGTYGVGANAWGDYDNDGKVDIVLGCYGKKEAYVVLNEEFNNTDGDVDMTEVAVLTIKAPAGNRYFAYPGSYSYSYSVPAQHTVAFWDRNNDGFDDVFVTDYYATFNSQRYCGCVYGISGFEMFGIGDFHAGEGDLPDGNTFYSKYRSYPFTASAWNKWDPMLSNMDIILSFHDYKVHIKYDGTNGLQNILDPMELVELDENYSTTVVGDSMILKFNLTFAFDLDECDIDVEYTASAAHMAYTESFEYVARLRNKMRYVGALETYLLKDGEDKELLRDGAWLAEGCNLEFTGVKVLYNGTEDFMDDFGVDPFYPANDLFHIETKSSINMFEIDNSSSGRNFTNTLTAGIKPL
ncbi:MAG: FG-GAP-like repeat-containing protein, partial [Candidatus Thermoplasmatota archaeon]|nr:FG-GAP-like repeat-containing protein [Candidatus Thermoplasmatota archaeon]